MGHLVNPITFRLGISTFWKINSVSHFYNSARSVFLFSDRVIVFFLFWLMQNRGMVLVRRLRLFSRRLRYKFVAKVFFLQSIFRLLALFVCLKRSSLLLRVYRHQRANSRVARQNASLYFMRRLGSFDVSHWAVYRSGIAQVRVVLYVCNIAHKLIPLPKVGMHLPRGLLFDETFAILQMFIQFGLVRFFFGRLLGWLSLLYNLNLHVGVVQPLRELFMFWISFYYASFYRVFFLLFRESDLLFYFFLGGLFFFLIC